MNELIVVRSAYIPNTAPTNRLLSMLRGFDELRVNITMVFIYPDEKGNRLDESLYKNVHVKYLWEGHFHKNKVIRYLCSFYDAWKYARYIRAGSNIFLNGSSEYLHLFVKRNDISVYHERTEHHDADPLHTVFQKKMYLKALSKVSCMYVISTNLRDTYKNLGCGRVIIVNMMVDATRFEGVKKDDDKEKYIAYCGTASNNKDGVDVLIKAFAIVSQRFPDIKLKIIGKAPSKDDESGNIALVKELGINTKVDFTGVVSAERMPQILKNAFVLALARPDSLQARCGFPTKLGEYLLTENPVVVTKVGDIPLFLRDGESALLAEHNNPKEIAKKLIWVIEHPEESKQIGKSGCELALRQFNYRIETSKIVQSIFGT